MLTLHPHDYPNDEDGLPQPLVTQTAWKGQEWQIGLGATTGGNQLRAIVCQKAGAPLLYFTRIARFRDVLSSLNEVCSTPSTDAFGLRMSLAHCLSEEKWGRAFFLNARWGLRQPKETAHHFFLLSPQGWGLYRNLTTVLTPQTLYKRQSEFTWSQDDEHQWLQTSPPSQVLERLKVQFDDPNSDFNFARHFASLSIEERRSVLWPCQHGDTTELQRVLRNAFLAQEELWNLHPSCTWAINLDESRERSCIYLEGDEEISSPELNAALDRVLAVFKPQHATATIQQHLCLQAIGYNNLYIEVENPSFHDRLEAALEWRDWLETNEK